MNTVLHIWLGIEVNQLVFLGKPSNCNDTVTPDFEIIPEMYVQDGDCKQVISLIGANTVHLLPETGIHPSKFHQKLKDMIENAGNGDVHFTTHSKQMVCLVSEFISNLYLSSSNVKVHIMTPDNLNIEAEPTFDDEGYYVGFPAGFFETFYEDPMVSDK